MNRTEGQDMVKKDAFPHKDSQQDSSHSQEHVLLVLLEHHPDVLEDFWCEQVNPTVDYITDERARLFHVMQYLICLLVFHNAAVVHGLLSVSRCPKDDKAMCVTMFLLEVQHVWQRKL